MKNNLLKIVLLFGILILFGGCATTMNNQGYTRLEDEDLDSAIETYEKKLETNPEDQQTLRELGVMYYRKANFEKAIPCLIRAFLQDTTDARTLFYLGTSYEMTEQFQYAWDIYSRYTDASKDDRLRNLVKSKMVNLLRKQITKEMKEVLAQEESIDAASIPDNTIAVLYFKNMGGSENLNPLQKGITDMLITDLSQIKNLKIVERIRMQKLFEEMGLGMTGLVDETTTPRVGQLLGASKLIKGTYIDQDKQNLRIDTGLIHTKEEKQVTMKHVEGTLDGLFKMEKDLVFSLIDQMEISLTQAERDAIEVIPTENLLAFLAYCRGLDYEDRGMFQDARQEFNNAVEIDPSFKRASESITRSESLIQAQVDVSEIEQVAAVSETKVAVPKVAATSLIDKMMHMENVLNQGFLPSIDSRNNPSQEESQPSFGNTVNFEIRVDLPE